MISPTPECQGLNIRAEGGAIEVSHVGFCPVANVLYSIQKDFKLLSTT